MFCGGIDDEVAECDRIIGQFVVFVYSYKAPVAQSVEHCTYRKEKCSGPGFDPQQEHFLKEKIFSSSLDTCLW